MSISNNNPLKGVGQAIKDVATGAINRTLQRLTGAGIGGNNRITSRSARSVSYTHLTLPTNREV